MLMLGHPARSGSTITGWLSETAIAPDAGRAALLGRRVAASSKLNAPEKANSTTQLSSHPAADDGTPTLNSALHVLPLWGSTPRPRPTQIELGAGGVRQLHAATYGDVCRRAPGSKMAG
jgi:hypothetical protein